MIHVSRTIAFLGPFLGGMICFGVVIRVVDGSDAPYNWYLWLVDTFKHQDEHLQK